jgi:hypothetical protein
MTGPRAGRAVTGLTLCVALAANACASVMPPRGAEPGLEATRGVAEAQGPAPVANATPASAAPTAPVSVPPTAANSEAATPSPPIEAEATPQSAPNDQIPPPRDYDEAVKGTSIPADPHRTRRLWAYAGFAIGGAAAGIAVVTSFMLLHQKSVVDQECNAQKQCSSAGIGETGSINETVPLNTTAWIVALVGLGGATILLLTSQPDSDGGKPAKSTAVTVAPAPGGASLGLRSTF